MCRSMPGGSRRATTTKSLEVILARNPLPGVTGYVCNHLCQTHCTRNDYEEPVAIRALKRYRCGERERLSRSPDAATGMRATSP